MRQVVTHFGGNRVVYLPDNGHPLEEFITYEGNFEEMEQALLEKYGQPQKTFKQVAKNFQNSYYIDYFNNLMKT